MKLREKIKNICNLYRSRITYEYFLIFFKKHKRKFEFLIIFLLFLFLIFSIIPSINIKGIKYVNLGAEIKLEKNQKAKLKFKKLSVNIVHFTNDSCPKDTKCFGEGTKAVEYIINNNKQSYAVGSMNVENNSGYTIETIDTDYKSYAIIKIIKQNTK